MDSQWFGGPSSLTNLAFLLFLAPKPTAAYYTSFVCLLSLETVQTDEVNNGNRIHRDVNRTGLRQTLLRGSEARSAKFCIDYLYGV